MTAMEKQANISRLKIFSGVQKTAPLNFLHSGFMKIFDLLNMKNIPSPP